MEFTVRGKPQVVEHIHGEATTLHDPLLTTVLDFDRRALDQLAHGLHLTVCHTYDNANGIDRNTFFKNENDAVNPSEDQAGRDVYYLLKHIYNRRGFYANQVLGESKEDIEEIVVFLKDHVRNQMAHQTYLGCTESSAGGCELIKNQTTSKCLAECVQLLECVVDAPFYAEIEEEVQKVINNLINMTAVFEDFKKVKQSVKAREQRNGYESNTDKAIERLTNLLEALEEEHQQPATVEDRPITHFINMVVGPRLKEERS